MQISVILLLEKTKLTDLLLLFVSLFLSATTRSLILEQDLRSKGELDYT